MGCGGSKPQAQTQNSNAAVVKAVSARFARPAIVEAGGGARRSGRRVVMFDSRRCGVCLSHVASYDRHQLENYAH